MSDHDHDAGAPGSPNSVDPPPPPGDDAELLIEAAAGAYRMHLPGPLRYHPAWHDLDADGRRRAYERARMLRKMEAALSGDGQSSTVHAVLARIRR
jgi:hypothetical protein